MCKERLTESQVRNTSCPALQNNLDLIDGNGLILRVSKTGSKSWRYRYKINGASKIITLGSYPELNLKEARRQRDKALFLKKAGVDPSIPKAGSSKPIQQLAPEPVSITESAKKSGITFKELVDEYINTLSHKPSCNDVRRALYKDLIPVWGKRNPESITLREAVLMLDKIAKRAPVLSDRLYAYLKRAYTVSIQRGLITINPLFSLQKPAPEAEIRNNAAKVLMRDDLRAILINSGEERFDDILNMILWTGARPKEVLNMQWKQIDGELWTLGAKEHKGAHRKEIILTRPLIEPALAIIEKYKGQHAELVFPGPKRTASPTSSLSHFLIRERLCYGVKKFTPNHLRHTISTRMREIGIRPDIVERIIGHHVDSGIIGVYSSYNWLPEMRDALEKWQKWIAG